MRRLPVLLPLAFLLLLLFSAVPAQAGGTTYEALRVANWRAPQETPVELCRLLITIDPLLEGRHAALLSLPRDFDWTAPDDTPALEDPAVVLRFEKTGENEMLATLDYAGEPQKVRFLIPIVATIPDDAEGDIVLSVDGIEGQLAPTAGETLGRVPGGEKKPEEPESPASPPEEEPAARPAPADDTDDKEPVDRAALTAVFALDGKSFTVDGRKAAMDVAPYVRDGRVYLPARYLALALGAPEDGIAWDGRRAVIRGPNRTVSLAPGSSAALVDGRMVQMENSVEVLPPGRLFLPARAVAQLFGAAVDWDPARGTVTIRPPA